MLETKDEEKDGRQARQDSPTDLALDLVLLPLTQVDRLVSVGDEADLHVQRETE